MTPEQHAEDIMRYVVENRDYLVDAPVRSRYVRMIAAAIREAVNDALERAAKEIECEKAAGDSWEARRINREINGFAEAVRSLKEKP